MCLGRNTTYQKMKRIVVFPNAEPGPILSQGWADGAVNQCFRYDEALNMKMIGDTSVWYFSSLVS